MVIEPTDDVVQNYAALQFDKLLSEASAAFIRVLAGEIDSEIERWLQRLAVALGIHKVTLVQLDPTDGQLKATHQWVQHGVTPNVLSEATENYPWVKANILSGEMIVLDDVNHAPSAASRDLQQAHKHGGKAIVTVPLRNSGSGNFYFDCDALVDRTDNPTADAYYGDFRYCARTTNSPRVLSASFGKRARMFFGSCRWRK